MVCYFTYVLGTRVNKNKQPPLINQPNQVNKTMTIQHNNFYISILSILKQNKSKNNSQLHLYYSQNRFTLQEQENGNAVQPWTLAYCQPIANLLLSSLLFPQYSSDPISLLQILISILQIILIIYFLINKQYQLQELQ